MQRVVERRDRAAVVFQRHAHFAELREQTHALRPARPDGEQKLVLPGRHIVAARAGRVIRQFRAPFLDLSKIAFFRRTVDETRKPLNFLVTSGRRHRGIGVNQMRQDHQAADPNPAAAHGFT